MKGYVGFRRNKNICVDPARLALALPKLKIAKSVLKGGWFYGFATAVSNLLLTVN